MNILSAQYHSPNVLIFHSGIHFFEPSVLKTIQIIYDLFWNQSCLLRIWSFVSRRASTWPFQNQNCIEEPSQRAGNHFEHKMLINYREKSLQVVLLFFAPFRANRNFRLPLPSLECSVAKKQQFSPSSRHNSSSINTKWLPTASHQRSVRRNTEVTAEMALRGWDSKAPPLESFEGGDRAGFVLRLLPFEALGRVFWGRRWKQRTTQGKVAVFLGRLEHVQPITKRQRRREGKLKNQIYALVCGTVDYFMTRK